MEDGQLLAELEEKEDGELDSDQEGQEDQKWVLHWTTLDFVLSD